MKVFRGGERRASWALVVCATAVITVNAGPASAATQSVTVPADLACVIESGAPSSGACADDRPLTAGRESWAPDREYRSLVRFDVGAYVQPGSRILSAEIRAAHAWNEQPSLETIVHVHEVTKPWTGAATWLRYDGTTSWTTPGGDYGPSLDSAPACCNDGVSTWDIAGLVSDWYSESKPNLGVILRSPNVDTYRRAAYGGVSLQITYENAAPFGAVAVQPQAVCAIHTGSTSPACSQQILVAGTDPWQPSRQYRTLVRYDLSSHVPAGSQIVSAVLRAGHGWSEQPSMGTTVHVHGVTKPWTTAATWTRYDATRNWDAPGGDFGARLASASACCNDDVSLWDVSALVDEWFTGATPNRGVIFESPDIDQYHKAEHGLPTLLVTFAPARRLGLGGDYPVELFGSEDDARLTVNLGNGNGFFESPDYSGDDLVGAPHEVRHRFNSLDGEPGKWTVGSVSDAPRLWPFDSGRLVAMIASDGHTTTFVNSGGRYGGPGAEEGDLTHDSSAPAGRKYRLALFSTGDVHYYGRSGVWWRTEFGAGGWIERRDTPADDDIYLDDSAGRSMVVYRTGGRAVAIQNWDGVVHDITYHGSAGDAVRPLAMFGPTGGAVARYGYDADRDNVTSVDDPTAPPLAVEYDTQDRVVSVTQGTAVTRFAYHDGYTTVTPPAGAVRHHFYERRSLQRVVTQTGSPPGVVGAGDLVQLLDGADPGDGPLTLTAIAGDTTGVRTLDLYVDGALSRASADCAAGCPRTFERAFTVDATALAQGAHSIRIVATGADGEQATEGPWRVSIDRTAPSAPANFRAFAPPGDPAVLVWDNASDPALPDGSPGSGIGTYEWRYRVGAGAWSEWATVSVGDDPMAPVTAGTMMTLEVRARDGAGNTGTARQETVVVSTAAPPGNAADTAYERCPMNSPSGVDAFGCFVHGGSADNMLRREQLGSLSASAMAPRPCSDETDSKGPPPRMQLQDNDWDDSGIWKFSAGYVAVVPAAPTRTDPNGWDVVQRWNIYATVNMRRTTPLLRMEWYTQCGPASHSLLAFETRLQPMDALRERRTDPASGNYSRSRFNRNWYRRMERLGGSTYRFRLRWRWRTIFALVPHVKTPVVRTHLLRCYENDRDIRVCSFDPLWPGTPRGEW